MIRSMLLLATSFAIAGAGPAAGQSKADEVAFTSARDGALVHAASGLRFPREAAGFHRMQTAAWAPRGEYVGVVYSRPAGRSRIEMKIAVVHIRQMPPKDHYVIAKPLALRGLSNVRTIAEEAYERPGTGQGYRGLHAARRDGRPVMAGLWAFERGEWDLRVRAEFPASRREEADQAVGDFVRAVTALNRRNSPPR